MSLSFLVKKTWHTQRTDNVEQVWLAEQKKDKEEKKLKELQKQIDEERQIEELRTLQKDAGLVTDPKQKLEWMYEGPGSAVASDAQAQEYKLGKAYEPTQQSEEMAALEDKQVAGSMWLDNTASNENELFSRLNQDPLYAMRQSQKRDREQKVLQNPLAMKRLRSSLRDELTAYEQKRAVRKASKKAKKAEKKRRKKEKKRRKRSPSSSSSRSRSPAARARSRSPRRRSPSPAAARARSPPRRDGYGLKKGRVDGARDRALGPDRGAVAAREREAAERRRRPAREQLTDDERARRLAEFARDGAAKHEAAQVRARRDGGDGSARAAVIEDEAELKRRAAAGTNPDGAKFLRDVRAEAYVGGGGDLADRVGRTRARRQKGGGGDEDL